MRASNHISAFDSATESEAPAAAVAASVPQMPIPAPAAQKTKRTSLRGHETERSLIIASLKQPKPIFLVGPSGCGKTTLLQDIFDEFGYTPWQIDEDQAMQTLLDIISRPSLIIQKRALVFEAALLQRISEVADAAKSAMPFPVFFVSDDTYEPKYDTLKKNCVLIKMQKLPSTLLLSYLTSLGCTRSIAEEIVEASNGSARKAVNQFNFMQRGRMSESVAAYDLQGDIFNDTRALCSGILKPHAIDLAASDAEKALDMVHENSVLAARDLIAFARHSEMLSFADTQRFEGIYLNPYALDIGLRSTVEACKGARKAPFIKNSTLSWDMYRRKGHAMLLSRACQSADIKAAIPSVWPPDMTKKKLLAFQLPRLTTLDHVLPSRLNAEERLFVLRTKVRQCSGAKALKDAGLWHSNVAVNAKLRETRWDEKK